MQAPFVYVASATGIGGRWQGSYGALTADILAGKFATVLLMDRFATREQVAYMQSKGLKVWAWEEPGPVKNNITGGEYHLDGLTNQRFVDMGYDGCVLQTENPDQRDGSLRLFQEGLASGKEKHIVTYYFGFDDGHGAEYWAKFKAAGVSKVHVEHYAPDHTNDTEAYINAGVSHGFPREDIIVVFGVYRAEFPDAYTNTDKAGRTFGCYIVDNFPDASTGDPNLTYWKAWGGLNKVALLQYWQIIGNKSGGKLFETRANTDASGTGLDRVEEWIGSHEQTIRDENGFRLIKVQH